MKFAKPTMPLIILVGTLGKLSALVYSILLIFVQCVTTNTVLVLRVSSCHYH